MLLCLLLGSFRCLPTIPAYIIKGVVSTRERSVRIPAKISGTIIANMNQIVLILGATASQSLLFFTFLPYRLEATTQTSWPEASVRKPFNCPAELSFPEKACPSL